MKARNPTHTSSHYRLVMDAFVCHALSEEFVPACDPKQKSSVGALVLAANNEGTQVGEGNHDPYDNFTTELRYVEQPRLNFFQRLTIKHDNDPESKRLVIADTSLSDRYSYDL